MTKYISLFSLLITSMSVVSAMESTDINSLNSPKLKVCFEYRGYHPDGYGTIEQACSNKKDNWFGKPNSHLLEREVKGNLLFAKGINNFVKLGQNEELKNAVKEMERVSGEHTIILSLKLTDKDPQAMWGMDELNLGTKFSPGIQEGPKERCYRNAEIKMNSHTFNQELWVNHHNERLPIYRNPDKLVRKMTKDILKASKKLEKCLENVDPQAYYEAKAEQARAKAEKERLLQQEINQASEAIKKISSEK